jgi:hypothetical protein
MSVHVVSEMAVLMRREAVQGAMSRWQSHRWVLADVVPHEAGFGETPRCLRQTDGEALWLYPAWRLELFSDDAEGYWLNLKAGIAMDRNDYRRGRPRQRERGLAMERS